MDLQLPSSCGSDVGDVADVSLALHEVEADSLPDEEPPESDVHIPTTGGFHNLPGISSGHQPDLWEWNSSWQRFVQAAGCVGARLPSCRVRLATDCTGIDAVVVALKQAQLAGLPIHFEYLAACEVNASCRDWILKQHKPRYLFTDCLERNWSDTSMAGAALDVMSNERVAYPEVDVYVAGCPCTAFSFLHSDTLLFSEPAARPFFAALALIRCRKPKLAVLENVMGMLRADALPRVHQELSALKGFHYIILPNLSPTRFGIPVNRPRVYIVVARVDVTPPYFEQRLKQLLANLELGVSTDVVDLLTLAFKSQPALPGSSAGSCACSVQQHCQRLAPLSLLRRAPWH